MLQQITRADAIKGKNEGPGKPRMWVLEGFTEAGQLGKGFLRRENLS